MKKHWQISRVATLLVALLWPSVAPIEAWAQGRMRRPPEREGSEAPAAYELAGTAGVSDGTLLICRMETRLDSKIAQPGDRFRARVIVPLTDARGRALVPANSLVEGHVESAQPAQRRRRSGIIEVGFDRLITPDGQNYELRGLLAPATAEDRQRFDEEGNIRAKGGNTKRTVALIGGGAGAGALVGAVTAGALLGAGVGAGVGVFAAWLAKGKEAIVEPGAKIGVELLEPLALQARPSSADRLASNPPPPESIRPNISTADPTANPTYNEPARPREPIPNYEAPRPRPTNEAPRPRPTATPATKPAQARPSPRPGTVAIKPEAERTDARDLQMVNLSAVLAERAADNTVRVSITGQTPTAGWKLVPEQTLEQGTLLIKLKGYQAQGMAAQVISYPTTLVSVPDPERQIQRVTVRGQNTTRTTTPLLRGSNAGSTAGQSETISPTGTRIADKLEALVEDYAKAQRAWRTADGTYSFENARDGGTPEAQLLYAFDRLAESARVFRGSLTPEVKRRAVRELNHGATQANRLLPFVRLSVEFTQRWQGIQREIAQLAAGTSGAN